MILRSIFSAAIASVVIAISTTNAVADDSGSQHALIVGIKNFDPDQLRDLPAAQQNAKQLAELLKRSGYADANVDVLSNAEGAISPRQLPTRSNILERLSDISELEREDTLLIAIAGHGLTGPDGEFLLCPFDGDLEDTDTLISVQTLYAAVDECPAKRKLIILDAIQASPFASGIEPSVSKRYRPALPQLPPSPRDTAVFIACAQGQAVAPASRAIKKRGGFLGVIAKAIQGEAAGADGSVTLPDVEGYVRKEFESASFHPTLSNNCKGLFTIVTHSLGDDDLEKIQKLIRGDRYDEADAIVARRLATHPNDAIALAQRARLIGYHAEQFRDYSRIDEALQAAEMSVSLAPNEALPYIARSNVYRIQKKYEKSLADASKAVQRDPNNAMAHVIKAFAMHHLHDLEGMKREAKKAMEVDPESPEARGTYVAYLFAKGKLNEGLAELDRAIAITPYMPSLYFLKGYGLEKQKKHHDAVAAYNKAIELNDQIPGYFCRRAISLSSIGKYDAAMADIAAAEKVYPEYFDIASARSMVIQSRRGYGHAEAVIAEGLKANPQSADLWQGRGFNHFNRREFTKALEAFNKVLEINPGYAEAHMGIGMTHFERNRLDDALVHLNRATRHKEHLSRAYYEKYRVHVRRRDYNSALVELEKAIKYEPGNAMMEKQRRQLVARGAKSTGAKSATKTASRPPQALPADQARKKASVDGKYSQLLAVLTVRGDVQQYGEFHDYGRWDETNYAGRRNLPPGYWVYVYPNWYIWKTQGPTVSRRPGSLVSTAAE